MDPKLRIKLKTLRRLKDNLEICIRRLLADIATDAIKSQAVRDKSEEDASELLLVAQFDKVDELLNRLNYSVYVIKTLMVGINVKSITNFKPMPDRYLLINPTTFKFNCSL